ncbi:TPA: LLM class flavin-dependent oxidoreductase [Staphylococcus aureus]|uniref:LLM class flavin-dependent oxidoreductase n=1 Tax=Staphylococcus aureus TaxID=1280 RepID=UPI0002423B97|nr:LLM class flavin-dependent oxidoreductase [Staphylococcus aureus]ALH98395.1 luciferase [Staphylococcus aureus]EHM57990.1 luciferase family oxidoreductase, group 1 [Staphylococcus aureus subsp. aureus 21202]MBO8774880.1 LLM class flavin-dependent oxidoreductase [Staphylococcus aureus]MCS4799500.1 LLM class flavin-dependent oxidoreductase [Staphylococcus aureus]MCS4889560.1 LLM class flavin-dependent oxidoreductase [Staphylococcus aureus]
MVKLSVLDYALIDEGKDAQKALQDSVTLAKLADRLGFKRIWFTEHHNVPAFACSSPELMMMHVLSQTSQIRVGSGGVMLPHYRPYKIAEHFRMMAALYPNRIDLGIGNNPGTTMVKQALDGIDPTYDSYDESISLLRDYLTIKDKPSAHTLGVQPHIGHFPEMWLLSSSPSSAKIAAEQGIGLSVGTFLLPNKEMIQSAKHNIDIYKTNFQVSTLKMDAKVMASVFVIVADNEAEVAALQHALDVWLLGKLQFAEFEHFPSVDTAQKYKLNDRDKEMIQAHQARIIAGTQEQVKAQLDDFIATFEVDEVLVAPLIPGIEQRCKTLKLLAEIYL